MSATRKEKDSLGEVDVPRDAYYGAQTTRAISNYQITGRTLPWELTRALAQVKKAAAAANLRSGDLKEETAVAIMAAADEVIAGGHKSEFRVDAFQSGAGVSQHMNMNEVLANLATETLGGDRGTYDKVHPNDHVNRSQSSNDVMPTSIRLATLPILDRLEANLAELIGSLHRKGEEFKSVIKAGRTHLQDAVPTTLGSEFHAYAETINAQLPFLATARSSIEQLNIGATAIGSGVNASDEYKIFVIEELRTLTGRPSLMAADNKYAVTGSMYSFAQLSAALRNLALELIKISNDLRLMASGPRTGLAEIHLPARQPGSSIMPGKVNPVIPEMMNQIGFQVLGNDTAISMAVQAGQLELNVMTPVIAKNLIESLTILENGTRTLDLLCISGITADEPRNRELAENSLAVLTSLTPIIGYAAAADIAKEALSSGKSIKKVTVDSGHLTGAEFDGMINDSLPPE